MEKHEDREGKKKKIVQKTSWCKRYINQCNYLEKEMYFSMSIFCSSAYATHFSLGATEFHAPISVQEK
jgi:hypothetical protein